MTNDDAAGMVAALHALGIGARVDCRTSTPKLEDGSYGPTQTIVSVIAKVADRSGNMVVREWESVPADLAKEVDGMRKDLKARTATTKARVKAERESR